MVREGRWGGCRIPFCWGTWLSGFQPVRLLPLRCTPVLSGDLVILTGWDGTWSSCTDAAETCLQQGGCQWPLCLPIYTRTSTVPCQRTKRCHAPGNGGFQGWGSWVSLLLVDYFCEMLEKATPVPVQLGGESAHSRLPPAVLPQLN